jgi:hypothetical protein
LSSVVLVRPLSEASSDSSQQPTPVLWPFPQSEHKAFFEQVPVDDFQFIPTEQGA